MVRERDHAFGQRILQLRAAIGLTQAGLADQLGVARKAVGSWEAGESYPKPDHLKQFIALGLQQHVFAAGQEGEQIRALWRAAHQKVLLDEPWLEHLLSRPAPAASPRRAPGADTEPRTDWADAPDVPELYGRTDELALLKRWVVAEHCRVVGVLGLGGMGKSALAVTLMRRLAPQFEVVLWRSLRDAPPCDVLVDGCLQVLAPHAVPNLDDSLAVRLHVLMAELRERRVLLVLDNLETLLEQGSGGMRVGFEGYARLLRLVAETAHQSCLLYTSREKPGDVVPLEGKHAPARSMRVVGLEVSAGAQLLGEHELAGSPDDAARLIERYQGNPLALKIVAHTVVELFGGEIAPLLAHREAVFGGISQLLDQHIARFSALEHTVFAWLAILREPAVVAELVAVLSVPTTPGHVLDALSGLHRRSIIERGQRTGSFTLHAVVLEYATARLILDASEELMHGRLEILRTYSMSQAQAKDYVRQAQEQQLAVPLLTRLQSMVAGTTALETRLLGLLDELRDEDTSAQGYAPANLTTLLRLFRDHLRRLDLSRLALRGVFLQGVEMQDARLGGALLRDSVLTEPFDAVAAVAISSTGQYWAAATWRGEIRVWSQDGQILHRVWQAHTAGGSALTFSPDGSLLASGGWDDTVKLWDVASGTLRWEGWHTGGIWDIAFAPDGGMLASGAGDTLIRLWDTHSGTNVQTLAGGGQVVRSLAWSPDGKVLAGGYSDGRIWIWEPGTATPESPVQSVMGHTNAVTGVAFVPDGTRFASASFDGTIKLWDTNSRACLQSLAGPPDRIQGVAWSPDGRTVAGSCFDHTIWLWDVRDARARAVLRGHTAVAFKVVFTPDSRTLLSGSDDGSLRVWDVDDGRCLRLVNGYVAALLALDWSPDGQRLVSGGMDTQVTLWNAANATSPTVLHGHRSLVAGVAWSPDGLLVASGGQDNSVRLWDTATGACVDVLQDPDAADTLYMGVAWSPDGRLLAGASYLRGVHVWDTRARSRRWIGHTQPTAIRQVAWSPDGAYLAGGGGDCLVYIWDARDGSQVLQMAGHDGAVVIVAWSPDGMRLASGSSGRAGGELFVWEARSGRRVGAMVEHPGVVSSVVWSSSGELLISGGSDGMLRWWDVDSGRCTRVRPAHQKTVEALKLSPDGRHLASGGADGAIVVWDVDSGEPLQTLRRDRPYERMDITGLIGVTEAQRASLLALGAVERHPDQVPLPASGV